ncbi:hypothetical protein AMJ50_00825 [Parcubacteria bacterium DG_74_3]|nr:MAG: hypothetical protein AMJ50_00825 [Parcubacteria bacterium DG_74_3]
MIILGIDPGTAATGYGVIKKARALKCLDCGVIRTSPSQTAAERLKIINNTLSKIIKFQQPEILAMEKVFFAKNLKTALLVSQAEGVILLTAAKKKIPVYQFTPMEIKMTITGYGWAKKERVKKKIEKLLNLEEISKSDDAIDALAAALTYLIKHKI